jgi:hypothetical protein
MNSNKYCSLWIASRRASEGLAGEAFAVIRQNAVFGQATQASKS